VPPSTCYTAIIGAFAQALEVVTVDLDVCFEETTNFTNTAMFWILYGKDV